MIGAVAEQLVGAVMGGTAAAGQNRRTPPAPVGGRAPPQQQQGQRYAHHNRQQQHQPRPLASLVESMTEIANKAWHATLKGVQYLLLLDALLLSAGVLYGALYWLVMPLRLHDKPLFFDYSIQDMGGPTATVDFLAQHTQWDPSPLTTVERLHGRVLKPGQHYEVGLELWMPTSFINRKVGVFMINTTLFDEEDEELASSARPAMLPHTSGLLKGLKVFFYWPLFMLGFKSEAETVYVSCMNFYQENGLHPLTKARVTISSKRVQFYRASVHVTPQLKGLPWLMHDWFYSTLATGVLFIASLELMIIGFCYVFFFLGLEEESSTTASNRTSISRITAGARAHGRAMMTQGGATASYSAAPTVSASFNNGQLTTGRSRNATEMARSGSGTWSTTVYDSGLRRRPAGSTRGSGGNLGHAPTRQQQQPPPGVQGYQRGGAQSLLAAEGVGGSAGVHVADAGGVSSLVRGSSEEERDAAAMASWAALERDETAGSSSRKSGELSGGAEPGVNSLSVDGYASDISGGCDGEGDSPVENADGIVTGGEGMSRVGTVVVEDRVSLGEMIDEGDTSW